MNKMRMLSNLRARLRGFIKASGGNVAMTLVLAAVPLTLAMGAGVDYARGLAVHSSMTDALDSAALAVGKATTKPSACSSSDSTTAASCATLQAVAQQYFNANFKKDSSSDSVGTVSIAIANQSVTLTVSDQVPTTFLKVADTLLHSTALESMTVTASSTVVWGQTKLWVALVLDNSGSMSESDSHGSKMDALHSAGDSLLTTLQAASQTAGDVQVAIVPFDREVDVGTSNSSAAWLYWGFWEQQPWDNVASTPVAIADGYMVTNSNELSQAVDFAAFGPGDPCPFTYDTTSWSGHTTIHTISPFGYTCTQGSANNSNDTDTIPSSGTYKGEICPGADSGTYNPDRHDHYYNGCWTSTKNGSNTVTVSSGSSAGCGDFVNSCSCSGSGSSRKCKVQAWTHAWVINNHSTWGGCITDRVQNYDIQDTTPVSTNTTGMPADNASDNSCVPSNVTPLNYNWTTLKSQIDGMAPHGTTNQAIGVANGWLTLTPGNPYGAPTIPANTSRYIVLLSDGLNTEDRWYGNGSSTGTSDTDKIDARENLACTAAKNDGVIIYTLFLDLGGTTGDSAPLQNCATDSSHYYDLTSTTQISTAFAAIAQQITQLRVSK